MYDFVGSSGCNLHKTFCQLSKLGQIKWLWQTLSAKRLAIFNSKWPTCCSFERNYECKYLCRQIIWSILSPTFSFLMAKSSKLSAYEFITKRDDIWQILTAMPGILNRGARPKICTCGPNVILPYSTKLRLQAGFWYR